MQVSKDLEELYNKMLEFKAYVNAQLLDGSFEAIRDLIRNIDSNELYPVLLEKDTQLSMLDIFLGIWLDEKRELSSLGFNNDILTNLHSLDELEDRYHIISLGILRLENNLPEDKCEEAINNFISLDISGIALFTVLKIDTIKRIENVIKLSNRLRAHKEYIRDMYLLKRAIAEFPGDKEIMTEMSYLLAEFEKQR